MHNGWGDERVFCHLTDKAMTHMHDMYEMIIINHVGARMGHMERDGV